MMWWTLLLSVSVAVEPGSTGDTGGVPSDTGAVADTAAGGSVGPAMSAAELAGEVGGCRCTAAHGPSGLAGSLLVVVVIAGRRRR